MRTARTNLIKMLTIALVVCLGVFVALIPMAKSPVSADEVSFAITSTSVNGAQKGLSFNGKLEGTPDEYGILVYPEGEVDTDLTAKENEEALDALNFLQQTSATIYYNRNTMLGWDSVNEDNVDQILKNFYAKDFIATPYFVVDGVTTYGESYTDNMYSVAKVALDSTSKVEKQVAQEILGYEVINDAVLEGDLDFANAEDGFTYPVEIYVNGMQFDAVNENVALLSSVITAKNVKSNVVDIRIVVEHETEQDENGYLTKTVCYNNLTYWTSIISDATELTNALTYKGDNNYGFYIMDSDITLTEALNIAYYTGTTNYTTGQGFMGQFDGAGHTIDFAGTGLAQGLFGSFCYAYSGTPGAGAQPKAQLTIKNFAVLNYNGSTGPVLAKVGVNHNSALEAVPHIENIYVTPLTGNYKTPALIYDPGVVVMNNVLVDGRGTMGDKVTTGAQYNNASGFYSTTRTSVGSTLFGALQNFRPEKSTIENFISIGNNPLAYSPIHSNWRGQMVAHEKLDDGTYNHYIKYGSWSDLYNAYGGYAGNLTSGDILVPLSLKANFLALVKDNAGTADLPGAICKTCYNQFSLVADGTATCPDCSVKMTKSTNLWNEIGAYVWGNHDLSGDVTVYHEAYAANGTRYSGFMQIEGTAKYVSYDALIDAYEENEDLYASFLGDDGEGFWKVDPNGKLMWHTSQIVYEYNDKVMFDASTGDFISTKAPADVKSVTAKVDVYNINTYGVNNGYTRTDSYELTVANQGIILTEGGYKLKALAQDSTETNGIPFMDTSVNTSKVITLEILAGSDLYVFNNVHYQTAVIYDIEDFADAVAIQAVTGYRKLGYYALANNVAVTDEMVEATRNLETDALTRKNALGLDYTGFNETTANGNSSRYGFNGQFDGNGYTVDFNRTYQPYGIFASFNTTWNQTPTLKYPITVENLAIVNYCANAPVLAFYMIEDTYNSSAIPRFNNIYVKMHAQDAASGLFKHGGMFQTNNVVVDATGTVSDSYTTDNAFGEDIVGKANIYNYNGGTLFANNRYGTKLFEDKLKNGSLLNGINNFVSIGKAPIVWNNAYTGKGSWYGTVVKHTLDAETGKYVHTVYNRTGWTSGDSVGIGNKTKAVEMYIGYAGNQTVADIPTIDAIKPNFLALVENYDGAKALPGAYCANCYNQFSLVVDGTATCPSCEGNPVMTIEPSGDIWSSPAVYTWYLQDLTNYDNATFGQSNAVMVFPGVSKYIDTTVMAEAYNANNDVFASFTGDAGNGLWSVVNGVLTWVGAQA